MAVLTSSLAAYALDFVVTLTDTVDLADFAANNAKSASDTVQITDNPSPGQTPFDSLPLSDGTSSNGQTVADIVDVTDSTFSNGQTVADTVDIADSTSRDTPARDEVVFSDFALPNNIAIDTVALSDSPLVESFIFHPVFASDTVDIGDDISPDSSIVDVVSLSESSSVQSNIFYELVASDVVALADIASLFSAVLDVIALDDSSSAQANIFYDILTSDVVAIADITSLFSAVLDTVTKADIATLGSSVIDIVDLSDISAVATNVFYEVLANDIVAIADAASLFSAIIDVVALDDSTALQSFIFNQVTASDIVDLADIASMRIPVTEIIELADAASLPLTSVTDIVDIIITSSLAIAKPLIEQLAVGDSFFDIAAAFNRTFSEILALPDCVFTNESGVCNTVGIGRLIIADLIQLMFISVNNPAEQISVQDQLARNYTGGRGATETMQARDSEAMSAASPPPAPPAAIAAMPMITMAETETMGEIGLADPSEAVEVGGTWNMSAFDNESLESLLAAMGMPVYNVSTMASSAGIEEMTMVLPSFLLSVEVGGEPSNDGVFLTPTVSDLPEGMQVMVPINAEESMDDAGSLGPLGNMTVSFTPAASAGNFTMMIAMLDNNPEQDVTNERPDGKSAFYLDVSFAGDFAGAAPSDEAFFDDGPQLTFTLNEEWAIENEVRLPRISLFMLDETTGEWIDISGAGLPDTIVGGVYTYTATLPHLSTFVVTADRVRDGNDPSEHAVSLSESLFITSQGGPAGSEGRAVIKDLAESLSIVEVRPETLHQRVITVDDVQVAFSIADIRTAAAFGTAIATLNFEITNRGDAAEELVIKYWYSNTGGMIYEDSLMVTIDAGASGSSIIEIPFSSAGVYDIMIEVASQDGTLASTSFAIEVPWLAANFFLLVIITVVVIGGSIGFVVYAMRARFGGGR